MNRAATFLLAILPACAALTLGCTASLPQAELAATAENQSGVEVRPAGGASQAASEGAPNLSTASETSTSTPEPTLEPTEEPTLAPAVQPSLAPPAATAAPQAVLAASTPVPVTQPANYAADGLAALNEARTSRGLAPLAANGALATAAAAYAQYMGQANFFGHYGPDGSSPQSRIRAAGFGGQYKGEALSAGQTSPAGAINALLASPAHAAILLEPSSVAAGVGYFYAPGSQYGHYWVVVTGNP